MSEPMRVEFDLEGFRRQIAVINEAASDAIRATLTGPQSQFIARAQVYITKQIDQAIRENGDIQEGETRTVRGQTWKGWAEWMVRRTRPGYGGTVTEGTRYYMRKTARGSVAKSTGRSWNKDARKAMMALSVADRPYEKVWKKRASGARFNAGSQLMQDTGRMRAGIFLVDPTISGGTVELRPGASQVSYFAKQNAMRPMWVLELPKDEEEIAKFAQQALDELAQKINGAA